MNILEKLADASTSRSSSEHLKLLGKRAAGLFVRGEVDSLNEAVGRVVDEEDGLTRDQVQRVSEMANQATWDEKFHRGGDPATIFEPASSSHVLDSLAEKAVQVSEPSLDYSNDPPKEAIPDDVDLAEMFGVKKDTPEYDALNPLGEVQATRENAKAASDTLRHTLDKLGSALHESGEKFYQMVKQAHLKYDHGVVQIAQAVALVTESPSFADEIMKTAAERLRSEGVAINTQKEMEKLAEAVVVDEEHPLLHAAASFEKAAQAYHKASRARDALEKENKRLDGYIRDKLRGT
jgi:hypothetical protein